MGTNWFRTFSFVAGTSIVLAACFLVFAGSTAVAQSGGGDLQAAVSSALAHDAMLKNQPVTASTANGVVTLTGTVETAQQRQEAETVAANVQGVSGIQNNITVTGDSGQQAQSAPPPPDAQQAPPPPPADNQQPRALRMRNKFLHRLPLISRVNPVSRQLHGRLMRLILRRELTGSSLATATILPATDQRAGDDSGRNAAADSHQRTTGHCEAAGRRDFPGHSGQRRV